MPAGRRPRGSDPGAARFAAVLNHGYGKSLGTLDNGAPAESIADSPGQAWNGDLVRCESMLIGQARALQAIFMNLSRQSIRQPYLRNCATVLRLALKTQSQCHARSETLAAIKNPPVAYGKQATVTSGPRQINNGMTAPSHAGKEICEPSRLLEAQAGDYLDAGTADATVEADSQVANVGEIDTPKSRRVRRGLRGARTRADGGWRVGKWDGCFGSKTTD